MASWRLMHRATGMVLTGYVVLSASTAEIDSANSNLRARNSEYRYVPSPCASERSPDKPVQAT